MNDYHSPVLPELNGEMAIGGAAIGPGNPCYVIAEAGSNHNGDLDTALGLIDAAADAAADAIKFQTFRGPDIASAYVDNDVRLPESLRRWGDNLEAFYASFALPDEFHEALAGHAKKRGITFLSSPFSETAVDRLAELNVPALKIASFELVHLPLIRHAAATGLPLILSTGMAGLGDIERALDAVVKGGGKRVSLLHCGSSYPLDESGANLAVMETLHRAFNVPVGFSDHTRGLGVPVAVAALGGNILEKHITLSRKGDGPDHSFAIEPDELKTMVGLIREAEAGIGSSCKRRLTEEEEHAKRGRRSLFSTRALLAGHRLTADDVKVVRPGIGIEPMFLDLLIGRRTVRAVDGDHPLSWDDFLAEGGE